MKLPEEQYKIMFGKKKKNMDWRGDLKDIIGVTDEKDIVDLSEMKEREILDEKHLYYLENERKPRTDSNIGD